MGERIGFGDLRRIYQQNSANSLSLKESVTLNPRLDNTDLGVPVPPLV